MAGDELLWKQVDELKGKSAPAQKRARASIQRTGKKRKSRKKAGVKRGKPSSAVTRPTDRSAQHRLDSSVGQPVDRVVDQSTGQLVGQVVDRPVSFYLPRSVDQKIDDAVDYMEKRHGLKVDRSAVVSAILGEPALWEAASLNQLVDKAIQQLTNRMTSRLTSRSSS